MAHLLVIGGTGMLADACLNLCAEGYAVSIVSRDAARQSSLADQALDKKGTLHPVSADYTDTDQLTVRLAEVIEKLGEPQMVIAWIHSHAQRAHSAIAALMKNKNVDYFHVRGSTDPRSLSERSLVQDQIEAFENIRYHQVILGFVRNENHSRWLTNKEISHGVLEAVKSKAPVFIVGTLEPFSARP